MKGARIHVRSLLRFRISSMIACGGVRFLYIMTHFARGASTGNGGSMAALSITRPPLKALKDPSISSAYRFSFVLIAYYDSIAACSVARHSLQAANVMMYTRREWNWNSSRLRLILSIRIGNKRISKTTDRQFWSSRIEWIHCIQRYITIVKRG